MTEDLTPILVVGSHRSGSTWLGKMLALARGVKYVSEPFNPQVGLKIFSHWFCYINEANQGEYSAEIAQLLKFHGRFRLSLPALKYWSNGFWPGKKRILIKDPIASFSADWLAQKFGARVVVLLRHPAAFYASLKRVNWHFDFNNFLAQKELMADHLAPLENLIKKPNKSFAEEAAILWLCLYTVLTKYLKKNPDWLMARHEDLALEPLEGFAALYQKLNLDFTPQIEKTIAQYSAAENVGQVKSGEELVLKRNSQALVKLWQKQLTPEEIKIIKEITGELAAHYYANDSW